MDLGPEELIYTEAQSTKGSLVGSEGRPGKQGALGEGLWHDLGAYCMWELNDRHAVS